jgi:beta-lactamase regulating signal transducer with metallopeptidase domain
MVYWIVDNLVFMGIAAMVIALLMLIVAWAGRTLFTGVWFQTGWIMAMLLLIIPVYWLIGLIRPNFDLWGDNDRIVAYLKTYVEFSNRPVSGEFFGSGITIGTLVFVCWLLGVVILTAWKLIRYFSFRDMILSGSVPSDERWIFAIPEEIRSKIKLRDAAIPSPFVFGIFRPTVVMPSHAESKEDVCFALMHELLHIERKDLLTKTIAEIVAVLHWFNPFAWIIRNQVTLACENACDEAVAAKLNEDGRKGYAAAILDFMDYSAAPEPNYPPTLMSFSGDADHVKRRLKNIMRYKKMSRSVLLISVCVILIVASAGILTAFSLALSGNGLRADTFDNAFSSITVDSDSTNKTEPTETVSPTPASEPYSEELTVLSAGGQVLITGAGITEVISGALIDSYAPVCYTLNHDRVAFLMIPEGEEYPSLYFCDGSQVTEVARRVSEFALCGDGSSIAYRDELKEAASGGRLVLYGTKDQSKTTIELRAVGNFAISPSGTSVGYSVINEEQQIEARVFFKAAEEQIVGLEQYVVALTDDASEVYTISWLSDMLTLSVVSGGQTVTLFSGSAGTNGDQIRLITNRDNSSALLISPEEAKLFVSGTDVTQLLETEGTSFYKETDTACAGILMSGYTVSCENIKADSFAKTAVFATSDAAGESIAVWLDAELIPRSASIAGRILAISNDASRVIYEMDDGTLMMAESVFGDGEVNPVELSGRLINGKIAFAADSSAYYLTDSGELYMISNSGKPTLLLEDVKDFVLAGPEGEEEVFCLTGYSELIEEENNQTVKRYGSTLLALEQEFGTYSREIGRFVYRVSGGAGGVYYECIEQRDPGSLGCKASTVFYYSSDGIVFTEVMQIG